MITKNKLDNKRTLYKKISLSIIMIFLFALMYVPKIKVQADDNIIKYNDEIKILEIEPGNEYRLTNDSTTTPREEPIASVEGLEAGQTVNVTHITMAEFISMVDEINGQYDVVVVGRKNDGLDSEYSDAKQYRDYTNPSSQLMQGLRYSNTGGLADFNKLANPKNPKDLADGRTYVEYYSENDITEKRAKEIQTMIKSNQLVYVEDNIFNSTGNKEITKTNLYKKFNKDINEDLKKYNNFKTSESKDINLNNIISDYKGLADNLKRPKIEVTKPADDKASDKAELYKRLLDFRIKSDKAEKLKVNIYLDVNADGLFKESELYKSKDISFTSSTNQETVSCNLDKEFIGQLDWKVEVIRENKDSGVDTEIKTNVISNSEFKPVNGKRKIKVLQIHPLTKTDETNLYLDNNINNTNQKFNNLIKELNGYELETDCISYDVFNKTLEAIDKTVNKKQNISNVEDSIKDMKDIQYKRKVKSIVADLNSGINYSKMPDVLNGSYDMVIIGFADSYGETNEFSKLAIEQLDAFVKTGQSVMFTHDTMSMNSIQKLDIQRGPKELTQHFRDYLGQSVFKDPLRLEDGDTSDTTTLQNKISEKDIYKERIITRNNDGKIIDSKLNDKDIKHTAFEQQYGVGLENYNIEQKSKIYSLGTTLKSIPWDTTQDTSVKKINGAQISEYPFKLNNTMTVSQTHTQWYQLNLEDPDVVPWYNLNSDGRTGNQAFDDGDSKNYFYTYSRGNLTYSGTGHSNGYTDDEFKLFINTIIKAERGANHAPSIKSSIANESIEGQTDVVNKIIAESNYTFNIDADDLEHERVTMHVTIDNNELTSENTDVELKDGNVFEINTADSSRSPVSITIPKTMLSDVGKRVVIKVDATDKQGANTQKKYVVETISAPVINVKAHLSKLTVKSSKSASDDEKIKDEVPIIIDEDQTKIDNVVSVKDNQYVNAEYTMGLEENPIEDKSGNIPKEVAILIDRTTIDKDALLQTKNGMMKAIIKNNQFLKDDGEKANAKFALLPYNRGKIEDYAKKKLGHGPIDDPEEGLKKIYDDIQTDSSATTASDTEGLDKALSMAEKFFEDNKQPNSGKTIVIISKTDLIKDMSKEEIDKLVNGSKNYNVVTVGISDKGYNDSADDESYLKELHEKLGGDESTYYISNRDNKDDPKTHNDLSSPLATITNKNIFERVADNLAAFRNNLFCSDVEMKFDLGKDIMPSEPSNLIKDSDGGDTQYKSNIDKLKFVADYRIDNLGDFIPSEDLLDEVINNVLDSVKSGKQPDNELKDMLNNRLSKTSSKILESSDVTSITNGISTKLSEKVGDLNLTAGSTQEKLLKDVRNNTVNEVLNSNATNAVKNVMKDVLKIGLSDKLNKIIKPGINNKDKIKNTIHYSSENTKINLNIKPVDNPTTDRLEFVTGKNKLLYKDALQNTQEYKIIKNPILQLDTIKIDHGLYKGLNKSEDLEFKCIKAIEKSGSVNISKGSIVTLASNINGMTSNTKIVLRINDPNCIVTEEPKAYRAKTTDGKVTMEKICDFSGPLTNAIGEKVYEITEFNVETDKNIIILYSVQANEKYNTFTNWIKAGSSKDVPVTITTNKDSLPDLY